MRNPLTAPPRLPEPAAPRGPSTPAVPYLVPVTPRWLTLKYRSVRGRESEDPELRGWQRNYRLNRVNTFSLFDEFMEMSAWVGAGWAVGRSGEGAPHPHPQLRVTPPPRSDPVRLHHHLRGRLPARPAARLLQQRRGDPPGRH